VACEGEVVGYGDAGVGCFGSLEYVGFFLGGEGGRDWFGGGGKG